MTRRDAGSLMRGAVLASALFAAAPVGAQTPEQISIGEIIRKAESREQENGFCARTGWVLGDNFEIFKAWLEGAMVGAWKVNLYKNGACELNRVTRIHYDKAGRCVTYTRWNCRRGAVCLTATAVDCIDGNGKLTTSD